VCEVFVYMCVCVGESEREERKRERESACVYVCVRVCVCDFVCVCVCVCVTRRVLTIVYKNICNIIHGHIGRKPVQRVRGFARMKMINWMTFQAHYEQAFAETVV